MTPLETARSIWAAQPQTEWAAALAQIPERSGDLYPRHAVRQCLLVMRHWRSEDGVLLSSTVPKEPER